MLKICKIAKRIFGQNRDFGEKLAFFDEKFDKWSFFQKF
jgi:hypothetical protein